MARNSFNMLLSASLVAAALVSVGINQPALAKAKRTYTAGRGAYFVPPPPPYAPSVLPENQGYNVSSDQLPEPTAQVAEKPPENPYKKYIYTREASDMPRVIKVGRTHNSNVVSYNFQKKI